MNTKCVCAEINSRNCPVHQNNDSWWNEFNKGNIDNGFPPHPPWIKAFIKDQITKAEKRGFDLGVELKEKGLDKAVEAIQDNHSSSDMPGCKCFEMPLQQEENGHTRYCERLSEEPKVTTDAAITKAQQEIAEQIIEDIAKMTRHDGAYNIQANAYNGAISDVTNELRKKYLIKQL